MTRSTRFTLMHTFAPLRPHTFSKHVVRNFPKLVPVSIFQNFAFSRTFPCEYNNLHSIFVKSCRTFATLLRRYKNIITSPTLSRFRYELYIEGKTHLVACTYFVSCSLFSFSRKGRTKRFIQQRIRYLRLLPPSGPFPSLCAGCEYTFGRVRIHFPG